MTPSFDNGDALVAGRGRGDLAGPAAVRHVRNTAWRTGEAEAIAQAGVDRLSRWERAVDELRGWPRYRAEPLWSLPALANELGLGAVFYKDESQRGGRALGSFKALGAPYAVFMLLVDVVEAATGVRPTATELRDGAFAHLTEPVTVCVATDGNQGRGLAWAAREFGCRCVVYVHGHVSAERKAAIERFGAIVIRVDGEYELSVSRAREDARMNDWHFVSSTSWDDYAEPLPRHVMNAYMTMVEEALKQVPDPAAITHVVMQGGVGSIAAAIFLGFALLPRSDSRRMIVVEPVEADCLLRSAQNNRPTPSAGTLRTIMAGMACREVSPAAWKILRWLASDFVTVDDAAVIEAMKRLSAGNDGDAPIVSGESAAGGTALLLAAHRDPALKDALGLDDRSQVLLFGGEGATDPGIYTQLVGSSPDDVFDRQG